MSHVDEGLLHAWLDGALHPEEGSEAGDVERHLAECPDCRARLEAARRLRDHAAEILAVAEPAELGAVPPFDELLARRAERSAAGVAPEQPGGQARSGRPPLRVAALAWAASLTLAVGAGWIARQILAPPAPLAVEERSAMRTPAAGRAAASGPPREEHARNREEAVRRRAREERARDRLERRDVEPPQREVAAAAPTPEPEAPTGDVAIAPTGSGARTGAAERAAAAPAAQAPAADAGAIEALPSRPMTDVAGVAKRGPTSADAWRVVDRAEAEQWVGGIYAIEGLPVVDYAIAEAEGEHRLRTRQRLADGTVIELVQRPSALALDELVVPGFAPPAQPERAAAPRDAVRAALDPSRRPAEQETRQQAQRVLEERARRRLSRMAIDSLAKPLAPPGIQADSATPATAAAATDAAVADVLGYTITARAPVPRDSLRALLRRLTSLH